MLLYAVAHRWRPSQVKEELKIRSGARYTKMIDNAGGISTFATEMQFKSAVGTWKVLSADESCIGKAIKHAGAAPGTKKGHEWYMSLSKLDRKMDEPGHKIGQFFFEKILPRVVTNSAGETRGRGLVLKLAPALTTTRKMSRTSGFSS